MSQTRRPQVTFLPLGNFFFEEYDVSAVYSVADTLCKSSELVGEGFSPNLFFVALYEVAVLLGLASDRVSD